MHFTLKTDPLKREDLDEFVKCYNPENRHQRKATWKEKASPLTPALSREGRGGW
jgi:type I restriction enzyme M protein